MRNEQVQYIYLTMRKYYLAPRSIHANSTNAQRMERKSVKYNLKTQWVRSEMPHGIDCIGAPRISYI